MPKKTTAVKPSKSSKPGLADWQAEEIESVRRKMADAAAGVEAKVKGRLYWMAQGQKIKRKLQRHE